MQTVGATFVSEKGQRIWKLKCVIDTSVICAMLPLYVPLLYARREVRRLYRNLVCSTAALFTPKENTSLEQAAEPPVEPWWARLLNRCGRLFEDGAGLPRRLSRVYQAGDWGSLGAGGRPFLFSIFIPLLSDKIGHFTK